jgi:hypothetical protein
MTSPSLSRPSLSNLNRHKKSDFERFSVRMSSILVRKFIGSLQRAQVSARHESIVFGLRDIIQTTMETFDFESGADLAELMKSLFDYQAQSRSNFGEAIIQCSTFIARKCDFSEAIFSIIAQHYDFIAQCISKWPSEALSFLITSLTKAALYYPNIFEQVMTPLFDLTCEKVLGMFIRSLDFRSELGIHRRKGIDLREVVHTLPAILSIDQFKTPIRITSQHSLHLTKPIRYQNIRVPLALRPRLLCDPLQHRHVVCQPPRLPLRGRKPNRLPSQFQAANSLREKSWLIRSWPPV